MIFPLSPDLSARHWLCYKHMVCCCVLQIGDEASILPSKLFEFLEGKLGASVISTEYPKKPAASKKASNTTKADELVVNTFMTFFAFLYGEWVWFLG